MANRDILTIGTSAGGVQALVFLAGRFPAGLQASIFITIHLPSEFQSTLDSILTRSGPLAASFARDGEVVERGRIYIAPPARHLIVDGDRVTLGLGPRENNARPAIDPMMRSAGVCCGARSIGVVLTGALGDGAAGLWALKQCGGIAVVQDPGDAAFSQMPETALRRSNADRVVPLAEMPALLEALVQEPAGEPMPAPEYIRFEVEIATNGHSSMGQMDRIGRRSVVTCPDCHGIMWQIDEADLVRYRCHLGHAYSEEMMSHALDESLRRSLGSGLRAIEERVALIEGMQERATLRDQVELAHSWGRKVREYQQEADAVRESLRRLDAIARFASRKERKGS